MSWLWGPSPLTPHPRSVQQDVGSRQGSPESLAQPASLPVSRVSGVAGRQMWAGMTSEAWGGEET